MGHGGIIISGPILLKPTNDVEREFYRWVYPIGLAALPAPHVAAAVGMAAPLPPLPGHAPVAHAPLRAFLPNYYGEHNDGVHIVLENLAHGLLHTRFLDIKIGARTCSEQELAAQGRNAASAWLKKKKLEFADWATLSGDRGFRVVASSGHPNDDRGEIARRDVDVVFNAFVGAGIVVPPAIPVVPAAAMRQTIATQLEQLRVGVNWCDYSMIAASVLTVVGWDAAAMPPAWVARTRLIDFAHSYHHQRLGAWNAEQFRKYSRNFSEGLAALSIAMCTYP